MPKIIQFLAITIMAVAIFSSCKKSENASYIMYADINGKAFNGASCFATAKNSALNIFGTIASDTTTTPTYPYIFLSIANFTGTGTYYIGVSSGGAGASIDSGSKNTTAGYSGTVVINSISPNITGSFSFTTLDSTQVTNGSFTALTP